MGMMRLIGRLVAGALASTGVASAGDAASPSPTVVELFQSQGCSDCPPAQDYLNRIADRPDIIALSFGVTYWDYLGWKDSFASPQFTQRQRDYAKASGNGEVATPQFWIDGDRTVLGANPTLVEQAIARPRPAQGPALTLANGTVMIGACRASRGSAEVWLVHYDPRIIAVAVRSGENGGRTLPHRDVVRELTLIGRWTGSALAFKLSPPRDPAWKSAVLVQAGAGGPILAATKG
jgi:hypothetical protein